MNIEHIGAQNGHRMCTIEGGDTHLGKNSAAGLLGQSSVNAKWIPKTDAESTAKHQNQFKKQVWIIGKADLTLQAPVIGTKEQSMHNIVDF